MGDLHGWIRAGICTGIRVWNSRLGSAREFAPKIAASGLAGLFSLSLCYTSDMLLPTFPNYGCFLRWPENGQGFIHPDDVPVVSRLLPSPRVLKRVSFDDTFYHYRYGKQRFRLRPAMWLPVSSDGIDIGDQVETKGIGLERERFVAIVWGMYYIARKGCILYRLRRRDRVVPDLYAAHQMKVLTNKARVQSGTTTHPLPKWDGSGETVPGPFLDE